MSVYNGSHEVLALASSFLLQLSSRRYFGRFAVQFFSSRLVFLQYRDSFVANSHSPLPNPGAFHPPEKL